MREKRASHKNTLRKHWGITHLEEKRREERDKGFTGLNLVFMRWKIESQTSHCFFCGECNYTCSLLSFKEHGESLVLSKTVLGKAFKDRMILVLHHIQGKLITLLTFGCSTAPPFIAEVIIFKIDPLVFEVSIQDLLDPKP
jgi:hypothetical protein